MEKSTEKGALEWKLPDRIVWEISNFLERMTKRKRKTFPFSSRNKALTEYKSVSL